MTLDVMANSLVYWTQDLVRAGLLAAGLAGLRDDLGGFDAGRPDVRRGVGGEVGARVALPAARDGAGAAGHGHQPSTRSGPASRSRPALMKIPEHDAIIEASMRRNPSGRMTTPQDVARAIVALSDDGVRFRTGNVIGVDGGEYITGS